MKKLIFFMVALVSAVTIQAKTIYLNAGDVWNNNSAVFFVHSWDDPANATDAQMTSVSGNIFQAEINDAHNNVIFLRLAPGKTEVVWETDEDCWGRTDNLTIADENDMFAITSYKEKSKFCDGNWSVYSSTPAIYAKNNWNNGDWAWKQMEYNKESDRYVLNNVVFGGTGININRAEDDNNALFFNADLNETPNLGIQVDRFDTINVTFNLNDSTIAVVIAGKYVAPAAPETKYYLVGSMNDWNIGADALVAVNADTLTITKNLEAIEYAFKIVKTFGEDTTWYGIQVTNDPMHYGHSTGYWMFPNKGDKQGNENIVLQTTKAGNYEFIVALNVTGATHPVVSVVIPEPDPEAPAIYAKNNWNNGAWAWKQMEYNKESDRYVLNNVVFGGTGIQIHNAETTETEAGLFFNADLNETPNLGIQVDQFDTINVTFNLNDSTIAVVIAGKYVAPAAPETKYYLVGSMNDWNIGADALVAVNADTLTITKNLEAIEYAFKIVKTFGEDTTWYGIQVTNDPMHYGHSTGYWMFPNKGDEQGNENIVLQTTKAGNYEFIVALNVTGATHPVVSVVIPEPDPEAPAIYAKNNWNNGDWAWKQMEYNTESDRYVLNNVVFGGTGININRAEDDNNALFFSADLNAERNLGIAVDQFDTINVTFNLNDSTIAVVIAGKYVAPAAPEAKYYITGTVIEGSTDEDWKRVEMIAGNDDTFTVNITLEADSTYMFKVVKVEGEETTWYGVKVTEQQPWNPMQSDDCTGWWLITGETGQNIGLKTTTAGTYTFIFEKNENNMISVVYPGTVTALDEVNDTRMNRKMLMNGVLYIIRDGKMYNVQGVQVR